MYSQERPASAEAILHPPARARVAEWGYLLVIAVFAVGIGAGALWASDRAGMSLKVSNGDDVTTEQTEETPGMNMGGH